MSEQGALAFLREPKEYATTTGLENLSSFSNKLGSTLSTPPPQLAIKIMSVSIELLMAY
jgi:hypothetical protein